MNRVLTHSNFTNEKLDMTSEEKGKAMGTSVFAGLYAGFFILLTASIIKLVSNFIFHSCSDKDFVNR